MCACWRADNAGSFRPEDAEWRRIAAALCSDSMDDKPAPFALTLPALTMRDVLDARAAFVSVNTAAARLVEAGSPSSVGASRPAVSGWGGAGDF
jgi:hypothetical protein